jgi:hypothetical protein
MNAAVHRAGKVCVRKSGDALIGWLMISGDTEAVRDAAEYANNIVQRSNRSFYP